MRQLAGLREERGFTFIELMISMLLMCFLCLAVWGLYASSYIFWKNAGYKDDMNDSSRIALDRMARELTYTRRPDSNPGGVLVNSSDNHLYFQIDDSSTTAKIHYYCESYVLYRQKNGGVPQPLASDIESVNFTYYDKDGAVVNPTTTALAATIKQVKIVLTAKKKGSNIEPVTQVRKVSLRSL